MPRGGDATPRALADPRALPPRAILALRLRGNGQRSAEARHSGVRILGVPVEEQDPGVWSDVQVGSCSRPEWTSADSGR